jgi:hypothetical protein
MKKCIFFSLIFLMVCGFVATQTLKLNSPNGGESWTIGTQKNITWTATNVSGSLRILLGKNNSLIGVIAKNLNPAVGLYTWTVGNYEGGKVLPGPGYQMRIQVQGGSIHDDIDGTFSIRMAQIPSGKPSVLNRVTITRPNPASNWKIYEKQDINWEAFPKPEYFYLELYNYNGTKRVEAIFEGPIEPYSGNKYRYNWNIPNIMSEPDLAKYKIKILAVTSAGPLDAFSGMFSIAKPWEKKHVVLNAALLINPILEKSGCDKWFYQPAQEKPGKARVGHYFFSQYAPPDDRWCGHIFRSRFQFPLDHLKGKVKLLLEAKLHMKDVTTVIEEPPFPNMPLMLYVLKSTQINLFSIPDQYFYKNMDIECDVTQQVTDWVIKNDTNLGFVATGRFNNFQNANIYFVTFFRPELEIWYLEDKN